LFNSLLSLKALSIRFSTARRKHLYC